MNKDNRNNINQNEYYDNEIELIDILRILWKRRYFIIISTIFITISAFIIFNLNPNKYKIGFTVVREPIIYREPITYIEPITYKEISDIAKVYKRNYLSELDIDYKSNHLFNYIKRYMRHNLNSNYKVEENKDTINIFCFTFDKEKTIDALNILSGKIVDYDNKKIGKIRKAIKKGTKEKYKQLDEYEKLIKKYNKDLKKLNEFKNAQNLKNKIIFVKAIELENNIRERLLVLIDKIRIIKKIMEKSNEIEIDHIQIEKNYTVAKINNIFIKTITVLVVSLLILVLLAFLIEYVKNNSLK